MAAGNGGPTDTSGLAGPLRHFADRLGKVRSADVPDMDQVGQVLVELATTVRTVTLSRSWSTEPQASLPLPNAIDTPASEAAGMVVTEEMTSRCRTRLNLVRDVP